MNLNKRTYYIVIAHAKVKQSSSSAIVLFNDRVAIQTL